MEEFIDYSKVIMGTLGHKLFVPLTSKVAPESKTSTDIDKLDSALLHLERTIKNIGKVEANGMQTADGFVVFKGSHVSLQDDDTTLIDLSDLHPICGTVYLLLRSHNVYFRANKKHLLKGA